MAKNVETREKSCGDDALRELRSEISPSLLLGLACSVSLAWRALWQYQRQYSAHAREQRQTGA
jgi:hypothetical protein